MRKIATILFGLFTFSTLMAQDGFVKFEKNQPGKTTLKYEDYMKGMNRIINFSGGIQVYHKGEVKFEYYKGVESDQSNKPISASSKFAIASLTKSFTAMMVLKLEEAGKIDLNKTVSDYLDYYPKNPGTKIKVIDLLNNRSGLPDYTARYEEVSSSNLGVKGFVVEFCAEELLFEPGSEYAYSNSGFFVLGAIIEVVTGMTYKAVIEREIIEVAKMDNSGVFERKREVDVALVDGHENMEKTDPFNPLTVYAAGAVYSTTSDLVSWYKHLSDYTMLSKATVDEMFSGKPIPYYKGWGYQVIQGKLGFGHTGGITGFNSQMITIPNEDLFVVILANNSTLPLQNLAKDLAAMTLGIEVPVPVVKGNANVPVPILKKFVGTYRHKNGNELQIGEENGKLFMHLFGTKRALKAESITKFYFDQFGPVLELSFDGGLIWHQDGNQYEYDRVNSDAPTVKVNKIVISESDLSKIVGSYVLARKKSEIQITWKNNQLVFVKDGGEEKVLVQKKGLNFYYSVSENGLFFRYPVDFKEEEGKMVLVYDGNIPYQKK